MENGGNVGKAMIAAGYSPATAKTPKKLTASKGWQELMDQYFPNEDTLKRQRVLLDAVQIHYLDFPVSTENKTIKRVVERNPGFKLLQILENKNKKLAYYLKPDYMIRGKALDTIYKLKGKYVIKIEENGYELNTKLEAALDRLGRALPTAGS